MPIGYDEMQNEAARFTIQFGVSISTGFSCGHT